MLGHFFVVCQRVTNRKVQGHRHGPAFVKGRLA